MIEDLTHLLERSLPHERRCGVVLEGLYAVAERDDDGTRLIINGELHAVDAPPCPDDCA